MKWYDITRKIHSTMADGETYTVGALSSLSGLTEDVVRNYVELLGVEKFKTKGVVMYRLNTPKKLKQRQTVLLALETARRFEEVEKLSRDEVLQRVKALNPDFPDLNIDSILSQLTAQNAVVRVGYKRNYQYLTKLPAFKSQAKRVSAQAASSASILHAGILQSALQVAEFIETAEARIKELEDDNAKLQKKLSRYEKIAKELAEE